MEGTVAGELVRSAELNSICGGIVVKQVSRGVFVELTQGAAHDVEQDCTGTRVYVGGEAAIQLCCVDGDVRALFHNARVVELGCGVGALSAAILSKCDAAFALATDGASRTVALAQATIAENGLGFGRAAAMRLRWGDGEEIADALEKYGPFDIVCGSELLYYTTDVDALLCTCDALLQGRNGLLFIVFLCRAEGLLKSLQAVAKKHKWHLFTGRVRDMLAEGGMSAEDTESIPYDTTLLLGRREDDHCEEESMGATHEPFSRLKDRLCPLERMLQEEQQLQEEEDSFSGALLHVEVE